MTEMTPDEIFLRLRVAMCRPTNPDADILSNAQLLDKLIGDLGELRGYRLLIHSAHD